MDRVLIGAGLAAALFLLYLLADFLLNDDPKDWPRHLDMSPEDRAAYRENPEAWLKSYEKLTSDLKKTAEASDEALQPAPVKPN